MQKEIFHYMCQWPTMDCLNTHNIAPLKEYWNHQKFGMVGCTFTNLEFWVLQNKPFKNSTMAERHFM